MDLAITVRASCYQIPGRLSTSRAMNAILTDPRESSLLVKELRRFCVWLWLGALWFAEAALMWPLQTPPGRLAAMLLR